MIGPTLVSSRGVLWVRSQNDAVIIHQKLNGTESQRTPFSKLPVVIRYSGLGVRSVGPVGDFLDTRKST